MIYVSFSAGIVIGATLGWYGRQLATQWFLAAQPIGTLVPGMLSPQLQHLYANPPPVFASLSAAIQWIQQNYPNAAITLSFPSLDAALAWAKQNLLPSMIVS